MSSELDKDYGLILHDLKEKIRQARIRASVVVNAQLLQVYWEIGQTILEQQKRLGWGKKVIKQLSVDLKTEFPDMKGFSERNLVYMQTFAAAYPQFTITQPAVAQITQGKPAEIEETDNQVSTITQGSPAQIETQSLDEIVRVPLAQLTWYHHTTLLDKVKDPEIRQFYIQKTVEGGWTRDMLVNQIESGLHKRQGALTHNFQRTLPDYQSELTQQLFKDPYNLDFIMLGLAAKERDLENAIINHITKVLIELGDGFAFMGRQYRLEAGGQEYFLDLLFYHTKLRRHVVIDLKIGDFLPEYAGKMNFYLGVTDDKLKGPQDEASIGLILCKTKNKIIAEYALRDTSKPIGIAEYRINERLPEDIKGELPSIEEIEEKLEKELDRPTNPLDAKLARIKELTKQMKGESLRERDNKSIIELFTQILPKLIERLEARLATIMKEFHNARISRILNEQYNYMTDVDLEARLLKEGVHRVGVNVNLQGFIKAGTKAFNVWKELKFELYQYYYHIKTFTNTDLTLQERLYQESWTEAELDQLTEQFAEIIADDVSQNIERIQNKK
jgi:predicted nuclease of restriction endonuclease-like (RecB) superfamily